MFIITVNLSIDKSLWINPLTKHGGVKELKSTNKSAKGRRLLDLLPPVLRKKKKHLIMSIYRAMKDILIYLISIMNFYWCYCPSKTVQ